MCINFFKNIHIYPPPPPTPKKNQICKCLKCKTEKIVILHRLWLETNKKILQTILFTGWLLSSFIARIWVTYLHSFYTYILESICSWFYFCNRYVQWIKKIILIMLCFIQKLFWKYVFYISLCILRLLYVSQVMQVRICTPNLVCISPVMLA